MERGNADDQGGAESRAEPDTGTVLAAVGARLRRDREARGVGVRELARRIGVSPSLISAIELGKANPSVGTLYEIVDELDLSLDELMLEQPSPRSAHPSPPADGPPGGPVRRASTRSTLHLQGVTWERLTADDDVDFLYVTCEVGAESCPEDNLMRHGGREYGTVLSGRLGVRIRFDSYELGPGDAISFASTEPHRFWTIGDEPSTSIWLVVGRRNDPLSSGT